MLWQFEEFPLDFGLGDGDDALAAVEMDEMLELHSDPSAPQAGEEVEFEHGEQAQQEEGEDAPPVEFNIMEEEEEAPSPSLRQEVCEALPSENYFAYVKSFQY